MSSVRAWAAALLSGVLLLLSFPKFGHGAVAWLALLPLLLGLVAGDGRRSLRLGYAAGVVSSVGLLYWTALVVTQYGGLSFWLGVAAMLALSLAAGLFLALFAAILGLWLRGFGRALVLCAPLAWVSVELTRRYTLFSFPWCLLGYSQHDVLPVVQIASWTGVYGVSFVVALVPSVIAFAASERLASRRWAAAGLGVALLGGTLAVGISRLHTPVPAAGTLRVGLVQASIPQDEKWDSLLALRNVQRHLSLSEQAARAGAQLVVWPESAVAFYYDSTPAIADRLRRHASEEHVNLLFGNDDRSDADEALVWVGAKLLTPEGELALRYHKMQLVPFGEYVPLEQALGRLGAKKLVAEAGRFTPGRDAAVGTAGRAHVGVSICYEAIFPDLVRRFTRGGADLLANITNDGWYGRTSAPYQHFAMARLRAVENGRSFIRAANTGISALIDPRGRIIDRTQLFEERALVGDVPLSREVTFYVRHGDVFAWTCFAATIALSLWALARRSRVEVHNRIESRGRRH